MGKHLALRAARLSAAAVLLGVLAAAGCIPGNVSWLPDSSGLVFSRYEDGRNQLVHYDLAKRSQRVVVKDTESRTNWPAVSPDGKRIAVARQAAYRNKPSTLQVVLYDLDGKEVQHSKTFPWPVTRATNGGDVELGETALGWSPDGEHLIVYGDLMKPNTAIYDVKNDQLNVHDGAMPLLMGGTSIRPDGKGFLVARESLESLEFITWDGKVQTITFKEAPPNKDAENLLWLSLMYTSGWDRDVAFSARGPAVWRIDTTKGTAVYQEQGRPEGKSEPADLRQQYVFENGTAVRIFEREEGSGEQKTKHCRIETLRPKATRAEVVVEKADPFCIFFPSPSKELLAVVYAPLGEQKSIIAVINNKGEVVASVNRDDK